MKYTTRITALLSLFTLTGMSCQLEVGEGSLEESLVTSVVVGGVTGAVMSATDQENAEAYAAAAGLVTFIVKESVRKNLEGRRRAHEDEGQFLDAEIGSADQAIANQREQLARADEDLTQYRERVRDLELQAERNAMVKSEAQDTLANVRATIAELKEEQASVNEQVEHYNAALKTSIEEHKDDPDQAELELRRNQLALKRDERRLQYAHLALRLDGAEDIESRLVALN